MFEDRIIYEILDDGTCSYCGKPADLVTLPNGLVMYKNTCNVCEEYNTDLDEKIYSAELAPWES